MFLRYETWNIPLNRIRIAYQPRSLLPERCFEDQRFNTSEKSWSYQCYIRGREAFDSPINPNLLVKGHGGTVLKTLQRGRSSRADCFLNWLVTLNAYNLKRNVTDLLNHSTRRKVFSRR